MFSSAFVCLLVSGKTTQPIFALLDEKAAHELRKKRSDLGVNPDQLRQSYG